MWRAFAKVKARGKGYDMGKLKVGQTKSYRVQQDAMDELGYNRKCTRRGAYRLNDNTVVWFPIMTQSKEDIDNRRYENYKVVKGDEVSIVEVAADEKKLDRILKSIDSLRIAFPRNKGEHYCFDGLYKYDGKGRDKLSVTWKRIATEIDTDDYPAL